MNAPVTKTVPHDIGAERAILGAVMLAPDTFHALVALDVVKDSFYREPHRVMWEAFADLMRASKPIDLVTISEDLDRKGKLSEIGGYTYLAGLPESCPGVTDAPHYADIVLRHARARALLSACAAATAELLQGGDPDAVAAEHQARITSGVPMPPSCSWEWETVASVMESIRHGGNDDSMPCHLPDVNEQFGGALVGEVTVVIAPPRTGKSVFCAQWGEHLAVNLEIPGCEFTLEMTRAQETTRRLSRWASVDYGLLQREQRRPEGTKSSLGAGEWSNLLSAKDALSAAPLRTDDALLTIEQIWSRTKAGVARDGWRWIVVDHFHIVKPSPGKSDENEARNHIANNLKALAKDCGVAVIVAAHMNKENMRRPDKRPQMGDIRYGGVLEGAAATVLGIYRDDLYNPESTLKDTAELSGIKARFGNGRNVRARWEGRYQRFLPLVREEPWD